MPPSPQGAEGVNGRMRLSLTGVAVEMNFATMD